MSRSAGIAALVVLGLLGCTSAAPPSAGSPLAATHQAITSASSSGLAPSQIRTPQGMVATHACQTDADCAPTGYCARWQGLGMPEFFCYPGPRPLRHAFGQPPPATPGGP